MGIQMNLVLCALVFLIRSSDIRGQNTDMPLSLGPALNLSEVPPTAPVHSTTAPLHNSTAPVHNSTAPVHNSTAPVHSSTAPASSYSSQPNSTLNTPLLQSPTSNSSSDNSSSDGSNSTVGITPVSTPVPTPQDHKALQNQTTTDVPITTGSVASSAPANGTTNEELASSSAPNIQQATNSPNISSPQPTTATTSSPKTTSTAPATAKNTASELNVGDEELPSVTRKSGAPLDPLLAGLVSVFIVSAAIVSLLLFLKFRRRNEGPEFRRLQDLPMDDMMEDTPLSMFSY
ncbi:hypothetical protein COCON_G00060890 [Conger conger]|uniref:Uncharacterized protein n=1 Tax=Conger conger TaxID=82655 RepID=A0A9Q1DRG4_CONCO|nr:uncharacterized protein LOC133126356 [Conger conger]KAJ8279023.1 hypothetical protein COCON_G00060890 [Conger conger]